MPSPEDAPGGWGSGDSVGPQAGHQAGRQGSRCLSAAVSDSRGLSDRASSATAPHGGPTRAVRRSRTPTASRATTPDAAEHQPLNAEPRREILNAQGRVSFALITAARDAGAAPRDPHPPPRPRRERHDRIYRTAPGPAARAARE